MSWPDLAAKASASNARWAPALADAVPALVDLETIGDGAPAPAPVLSHNSLTPGNVRLGTDEQLIVFGWEHAGGQPPGWELSNALLHWTVNRVVE